MLLMMRLRCCGAGPSPVPVLLLEQSPWVLGSTDRIKADGGDGWGGLRGESFGGPVFSGDRGGNLARCRSWAVGRRRPKAGGWGAERAHLARAVQGPTDSTCRPAARIAGSANFGLLTEETAGRKLAESATLLLGGGAGGLQRVEKASAH